MPNDKEQRNAVRCLCCENVWLVIVNLFGIFSNQSDWQLVQNQI